MIRQASAGSTRNLVRPVTASATISTPAALPYQGGLASSGQQAMKARTPAAAVAGQPGSLVRVPAAATVSTAPAPAQNQPQPWMSGYTETDARITAPAAVRVSRGFTGALR